MPTSFETVTELPGHQASAEQLSMIHTRYRLALEHCEGKDVLEAACGPGRGLGYLARRARSVVGGDLTPELVRLAEAHYRGRLRVLELDAQALPFPDASFDVIILFEALYYLPRVDAFLSEARRVLRPGGKLLLCAPNPEWPEFNPSPLSRRYHSAAELKELLSAAGFEPSVLAGFRAAPGTVTGLVRRAAVSLGLVPRTMKGKALLKRLFYGRLSRLGPELDDSAPVEPLVPAPPGPVAGYKVLYAVAAKRA